MHEHHPRTSLRIPLSGPRTRIGFTLGCFLAMGLALAAPATAAECGDCPGPVLDDLKNQPGFPQELLDPPFWGDRLFLETDGGECRVSVEGTPEVTRGSSWFVLRGQGEVWDCPHSASSDRISAETRASDSTSWSATATVGIDVDTVIAAISAKISAGQTRGASITEVHRIEKTITAKYCRRIPWRGQFEIAEFSLTADISVERRWSWWVKSLHGGAEVFAAGEVWMHCGAGRATLSRQAPISGSFRLAQRGCDDPECEGVESRDLGVFEYVPPPVTPPSTEPADERPTTPSTVDPNAPDGDPVDPKAEPDRDRDDEPSDPNANPTDPNAPDGATTR